MRVSVTYEYDAESFPQSCAECPAETCRLPIAADGVSLKKGYESKRHKLCPLKVVDDEWLSATEAAELLGVTRSMACRLCKEGKLQAKKVGTSWVVESASVMERAANPPNRWRPKKEA